MVEGSLETDIGRIKDDKILIKFRPEVGITTYDIDYIKIFGNIARHIPSISGITLRLHDRSKVEDAISNIRGLSHVLEIKRNVIIAHVAAIEEPVPRGITTIRAPVVHSVGNKGDGIKVGISDTGVDNNHPNLKNNFKAGFNAITGDNNQMDNYGHGTHCAGTIAANGSIIGVAPNAGIYSAKILDKWGSGGLVDIVEGTQWLIDQGVNVISMSWGGAASADWSSVTTVLNDAYNKGILLVAAAGNNNADVSGFYPAGLDIVIAVAALDSNYNKAAFSNFGSGIDVSAPGTMTYSTSTSDSKACLYWSGGYVWLAGTSMACPHVAGVGALLKKAHPEYSVSQLMTAMRNGCISLGNVNLGKGLIDAPSVVNGTTPPGIPALPGYYYTCTSGGTEQGVCNKTTGGGADACWHHWNCRQDHYACTDTVFGKTCKACKTGPIIGKDNCTFECEGKGYHCGEIAGKPYCKYTFGNPGDPLPQYRTRDECQPICEGGGDPGVCNPPVVNLSISEDSGDGNGGISRFACEEYQYENILIKYCNPDPTGPYTSYEECKAACPTFGYGYSLKKSRK